MNKKEQIRQEAINLRANTMQGIPLEKMDSITQEYVLSKAKQDVDWFLSLKTADWSVGIVDEKAELPENPYDKTRYGQYGDSPLYNSYNKAQQDMAGYRKII
jgi:hypothetical protein